MTHAEKRKHLDAMGAVLAYVSGRWYETEYGCSEDRWYSRAMYFIEARYAELAHEVTCG